MCDRVPGGSLDLSPISWLWPCQIGSEGFDDMHEVDMKELLEGHMAELTDEELVELTQSTEKGEGKDFAQPHLTLNNLAESLRVVKAVKDYFYSISL